MYTCKGLDTKSISQLHINYKKYYKMLNNYVLIGLLDESLETGVTDYKLDTNQY